MLRLGVIWVEQKADLQFTFQMVVLAYNIQANAKLDFDNYPAKKLKEINAALIWTVYI